MMFDLSKIIQSQLTCAVNGLVGKTNHSVFLSTVFFLFYVLRGIIYNNQSIPIEAVCSIKRGIIQERFVCSLTVVIWSIIYFSIVTSNLVALALTMLVLESVSQVAYFTRCQSINPCDNRHTVKKAVL